MTVITFDKPVVELDKKLLMHSNSFKHENLPLSLVCPANHIDLFSFILHTQPEWKRPYKPENPQVMCANCSDSRIDHLN